MDCLVGASTDHCYNSAILVALLGMFRILTVLCAFGMVLPLLGAGCSQTNDVDSTYATYSVTIETSPQQTEIRQATLTEAETTMTTLLNQVGIQTALAPRKGAVAVATLNGVISTLHREWHLYINNTLQTFIHLDHVPVRASDTIEWKYETTTNNEQ